MTTFKIKRNDTQPYLAVQMKSEDTGNALNLTAGSKIYFNLSTNDNSYTTVLSGAATVTGSATGECEYRWAAGDTARSGLYLAEFQVTYNDGAVLTLPNDHSLLIDISEDYD